MRLRRFLLVMMILEVIYLFNYPPRKLNDISGDGVKAAVADLNFSSSECKNPSAKALPIGYKIIIKKDVIEVTTKDIAHSFSERELL